MFTLPGSVAIKSAIPHVAVKDAATDMARNQAYLAEMGGDMLRFGEQAVEVMQKLDSVFAEIRDALSGGLPASAGELVSLVQELSTALGGYNSTIDEIVRTHAEIEAAALND